MLRSFVIWSRAQQSVEKERVVLARREDRVMRAAWNDWTLALYVVYKYTRER